MAARRALYWRPVHDEGAPAIDRTPFPRGLFQGSAADLFVLGRVGAAGSRRPVLAAAVSPLAASIRIAGIPTSAGTPIEEALRLLELAAAIAHALLVQYLYAGSSCA